MLSTGVILACVPAIIVILISYSKILAAICIAIVVLSVHSNNPATRPSAGAAALLLAAVGIGFSSGAISPLLLLISGIGALRIVIVKERTFTSQAEAEVKADESAEAVEAETVSTPASDVVEEDASVETEETKEEEDHE